MKKLGPSLGREKMKTMMITKISWGGLFGYFNELCETNGLSLDVKLVVKFCCLFASMNGILLSSQKPFFLNL